MGHGSDGPEEGPVLEGEGETDYERYLKVPTLLELQKPLDELNHHDELLFQTVHQASELWFKHVLFEMHTAADHMEADRPVKARALIERATQAMELLRDHLHMLDTMNPWDFHVIRRGLGRGSGSESPGFRRVLAEVPPLYPRFEELLDRRDVDLEELYVDPDDREDLYGLAEALLDFDQAFQLWRSDHLRLVKRQIGGAVTSLKGYEVEQLEEDIEMALFPELWGVRNDLTERAGTSPG